MLIKNDILKFEEFIIDVNNKTIIIDYYEISTNLFIRQRDSFIRRRVFLNHRIIVFFDTQIQISFDYKISDDRDFLFEFFIELDCIMFHHLINSYISEIVV